MQKIRVRSGGIESGYIKLPTMREVQRQNCGLEVARRLIALFLSDIVNAATNDWTARVWSYLYEEIAIRLERAHLQSPARPSLLIASTPLATLVKEIAARPDITSFHFIQKAG